MYVAVAVAVVVVVVAHRRRRRRARYISVAARKGREKERQTILHLTHTYVCVVYTPPAVAAVYTPTQRHVSRVPSKRFSMHHFSRASECALSSTQGKTTE